MDRRHGRRASPVISDSYKKHLLEAAERGDAEAQFNLRAIYENGLNIDQSGREGPVDDRRLARGPSPKRSFRLRAGVHRFDAGRNRTSQVLCARLEAVSTDRST